MGPTTGANYLKEFCAEEKLRALLMEPDSVINYKAILHGGSLCL